MKKLLMVGVILLLTGILALATFHRVEGTIKVSRGGDGGVRRLPDGGVVNFYTAYLENRSRTPACYGISVAGMAGEKVELLGPTENIKVDANENRRVDFMVRVTPAPSSPEKLKLRLLRGGKPMAEAEMTLLVR